MGESAGCNDGAASGKQHRMIGLGRRWRCADGFRFERPDKHGAGPLRGTSPPRRVELVVVQGERRALDGVGDRHNPQVIARVGEPVAIARQQQHTARSTHREDRTCATLPYLKGACPQVVHSPISAPDRGRPCPEPPGRWRLCPVAVVLVRSSGAADAIRVPRSRLPLEDDDRDTPFGSDLVVVEVGDLLGLCPVQPVALVTVGHSAVGLAATPSPDQWV
jgi:hypothetical protein